MRVVEILNSGGPEALQVADRATPSPAAGELLIEVKAAGVSHADVMQRQGNYPPPPGASDILGLEVAGVVAGVGEGAGAWKAGDAVCALLAGGGYAEYVNVPAAQALPVPERWSFIEAASLPENMFTVWDNLFTRARLARGESVLVHGGTSGVGTTAIMLARAFGASFIVATAGSAEKCDACRKVGADAAIDYRSEDFVRAVLDATGGRGVSVILDLVGGDYVARDLQAIALDGRIACIATQQGQMAQIDLGMLLRKRATIGGSSLRARSVDQKRAIAEQLQSKVWPLLPKRDPIRPVIDSTFPLDRAPDAHRRLESSAHVGKIVLTLA